MRTGFIGLGRMGSGMAMRLTEAGIDLTVFDLDAAAAKPFTDRGARLATDVGDLVRHCDVIFTSLPGPPQIEQVVFGHDGILENAFEGLCLFDLSTSSRSLARRIADALDARGATMLDAPVSGGPAGAASGELVIWVGGNKAAFDRHVDLLGAIARNPVHVGDVGAGTVIKLAHNLLGYSIMLAEAEVFAMAVKAGVDPLDLWQALRLGVVGRQSPLDMLVNQFLPGDYDTPAFALKLARKDVVLATEMARELEVPMRLGGLTLAEMTEAIASGMGDRDSRAYLELQLKRSGVAIAVSRERIAAAVQQARS